MSLFCRWVKKSASKTDVPRKPLWNKKVENKGKVILMKNLKTRKSSENFKKIQKTSESFKII